jgi:phosphoribosylaminoimidazole synthetase
MDESRDDLSSAYRSAGVDITAGNRAVDLMRAAVTGTYGPEVLAGIGAFGGLYDAVALQGMTRPVLVASTDGVGTKVKLAALADRYEGIGHDLVNHCIDDILVQGARPLFFLDYFATAKLDPLVVARVVSGLAAACRAAGMALLGGETAEMPGVYLPGEFDLAGTIVGVVDRAEIIDGHAIAPGDVLLGLRSTGPHTNGYSLIRRVFADTPPDAEFPGVGSLMDALLAPHRSYLDLVTRLRAAVPIKGLAHLTGGGFIENIPRILPPGVAARVRPGAWPVPPLFALIQSRGAIDAREMYRVFNMGIGMIVVLAAEHAAAAQAAAGEETWIVGEIVPGDRRVELG